MKKLVYGVGLYEKGKYLCRVEGKQCKVYNMWKGMLERCYSPNRQLKWPTYKDCEVSENFKNFQYFAEWCHNQVGFGNQGYDLDKDILSKSTGIYSEYTCVFIPRELNTLLNRNEAIRGDCPIGVHFSKQRGRYFAYVNIRGKKKQLGQFLTANEAFSAYSQAKEKHVKDVAVKYKDKIDPRVYQALMSWTVKNPQSKAYTVP